MTGAPTSEHADARPASRHDRPEQRKKGVLTKGTSSTVDSITDAVVAKDGEPFFLCRPDGQVPADGRHGFGFYHHDCRFLAGYALTIGGRKPDQLAATVNDPTTIVLELTNPALHDDHLDLDKDQLGIRWTRRVDEAGPALRDEIRIRNFGAGAVDLSLGLRFAAAFEDVFTIRGLMAHERGTQEPPRWDGNELRFDYRGADGVERRTRVTVSPASDDTDERGCRIGVHLEGRGTATVHVEVRLEERTEKGASPIEGRGAPDRRPESDERRAGAHRATDVGHWIGGEGWQVSIRTTSFALQAAIARSFDDLAQLRSTLDGLRYYEAGIPWFATLFGRDSLIAALQSLAFDPDVAAETLRLLARRQGTHDDDWRDEAPGKILHELRIGELARTGAIPHSPYYGTVDATPLFLILLARHASQTGSLALFTELREHVEAALGWIARTVDAADDGFLAYGGGSHDALVNQGWKDSGNAIVKADGDLADPPIALAEVQGYVYRAWLEVAELFDRSNDADRASELRRRAGRLQEGFEQRFWSDELGCYVLALGNGVPCEVVTSNAGQVLWSGIASRDRATAVADRLLRPDMFSGWGIRTLSSDATAYRPIGYHLGTVWPHDNSLIGAGFRRYGLDDAAERIFLGMQEAAQDFDHDRLPECFAGFSRDEFGVPVDYPIACHPQAWAAGTIPYLLMSILGLEADGFARELRVCDPRLPEGIERVELRDLPVGDGTVQIAFKRDGTKTIVRTIEASNGVTVDAGGASRAVAR